jgi:hypothetical protein
MKMSIEETATSVKNLNFLIYNTSKFYEKKTLIDARETIISDLAKKLQIQRKKMRNISPLLINMPTDMADTFRQIGKNHDVSRTKVILEACRRFLNDQHAFRPPINTKQRTWLQRDDADLPPAFFSTSGTGF